MKRAAPQSFLPGMPSPMARSALVIRPWRLWLSRCWDATLPCLTVIGVNPSVADGDGDDTTISTCIRIARDLGCGSLMMVNLYGWIDTAPRDLVAAMKRGDDVIGPDNDRHIINAVDRSVWSGGPVIAAWGAVGAFAAERMAAVTALVTARCELRAFAITKDGSPHHPTRLSRLITSSHVLFASSRRQHPVLYPSPCPAVATEVGCEYALDKQTLIRYEWNHIWRSYRDEKYAGSMVVGSYPDSEVPAVFNAHAEIRRIGIGRMSLKALAEHYGVLRSSPDGITSPDACKAWEAVGGVAPVGENTAYGRSKYFLLASVAVKS